ncbi:hypothetical protein Taro_003275, partial [Colocasia esculenta]|nr:hypothetical protein [Colocasia esculenta]
KAGNDANLLAAALRRGDQGFRLGALRRGAQRFWLPGLPPRLRRRQGLPPRLRQLQVYVYVMTQNSIYYCSHYILIFYCVYNFVSPTTPVAPPFPSSSPPEVESQHPAADDEGPQLPGQQPCWISGGKIDPGSASRYITTLVHAHIPGPVDAWREFPVPVRDLLYEMFTWRYVFTRPENLPQARAVWESTAQTNLRKSMYEVRDKAIKTTSSRDPMAWLDYGPVWLRRDYWESLCHRWATGPWQERSQAAKHN